MDPTAVVILGVLWFLVNLLSGGKKKLPTRPPRAQPRPINPAATGDPTQREGSRLEALLRQFEQTLENAEAEGRGREVRLSLPGYEEIEERESLEVAPEVVSLEQEVRRTPRREFTQDEDAESLVQRRIAAAAARDTGRSRADHVEFDQEIRKEPADHTDTSGYTVRQLRDAVVWREILGPPVSLREEQG